MRPLRRSRPGPGPDDVDLAVIASSRWPGADEDEEGTYAGYGALVPEEPDDDGDAYPPDDPHDPQDPHATGRARGPVRGPAGRTPRETDRVRKAPTDPRDPAGAEQVPAASAPTALPGQRTRLRLRVGVGAAAVLVAAALVVTILVTAVQEAGAGRAGEPPPAHASSAAHGAGTDRDGGGASTADDDDGTAGTGSGSAAGTSAGSPSRTADGQDGVADAGAADMGDGSRTASRTPIYVHVVGAVVAPGLFPLAPGSRVVDALAAAHGFADGADTAGVNLARVLSDGEQLVVPRQGEAPAAPAGQAAGASPAGGGAASPSAPVDLNTATAEQLETLPRVGPSLAARIIAWRSAHGRFARVADLGRVPGIGDRTLASLTPLVRV
jgi:competence protein ComEA